MNASIRAARVPRHGEEKPFGCRIPGAVMSRLPSFPEVSPLPAARTGHITFGALNQFAKVNEDLLRCWAALLHRVPESRLLMSCSGRHGASERTCRRFRSRYRTGAAAANRPLPVGGIRAPAGRDRSRPGYLPVQWHDHDLPFPVDGRACRHALRCGKRLPGGRQPAASDWSP